MLRPSARRAVVVESVQARVATVGQTHIGSVVINEAGQHYRVPLTELTALHKDMPFAPPPGFADFSPALRSRRVVLAVGPDGCGKEMAVTHALRTNGATTVKLLPADLSVSEMSRVVQAGADESDAFVLPGLDEAALRALAGPAGQPIRAAVSAGRVTVAVVTSAEPAATAQRDFGVVLLGYPDASQVLAIYARHRSVSQSAHGLAEQVLSQLRPPVCPATVTAILGEVSAHPAKTAPEIAALFNADVSDEAVRQWLSEGRPSADVATLAAGAALSGAPSLVVQEHAQDLARLLHPAEARDQTPPLLGGAIWAAGLLRTATEKVNTHFGIQALETVQVSDPHRPAEIVLAIWRSLGTQFRSCYCDWLSMLPKAPQLRWHASYTAGVLFAADPVLIEGRILRPWAHSDQSPLRRCAGLALGAPLAAGADPTPSRALAHAWGTSGSVNLREAAITAYGGLLGAWDPISAAPLKLFRIGQTTPVLRHDADLALARLMVAGAEASAAREGVLAYLKLAVTDRGTRTRVFSCLARATEALTWPRAVCMESLTALRSEPGNWDTLTALLATAMITPAGVGHAQDCLFLLVRGVARGVIDDDVAEDAIRGMKHSQRGFGTMPKLGSNIRRALSKFSRSGDDAVKHVATTLINHFFE